MSCVTVSVGPESNRVFATLFLFCISFLIDPESNSINPPKHVLRTSNKHNKYTRTTDLSTNQSTHASGGNFWSGLTLGAMIRRLTHSVTTEPLVRRVEDGVDGRDGLAGSSSSRSGSGGGVSRSSTLIGRRLAGGNSSGDLIGQTDREDSPLHSKRSSMCLT